MHTAAAPITAVPIQLKITSGRPAGNFPITYCLDAKRMMTAINGTATTPLITAL
jgi:hypothetical protein